MFGRKMVVEDNATEIEDHYKGGARHGRCSLRPVNSDRGSILAPAEGIVNGWCEARDHEMLQVRRRWHELREFPNGKHDLRPCPLVAGAAQCRP